MSDDRYQIVSFRGWTFDRYTVAWIEAVEAKLGGPLVIFQDSYNEGVDQSAGTHDRGGAVDCAPPAGKTFNDLLRAARSCAGFGWVRDPSQGDWQWHFHGGPLGHERQADLLDLQEQGYRQHRDGLGPWPFGADPTWHPDPIPAAFPYPQEDEMTQDDFERIRAIVNDEVTESVGPLRERINEIAKAERERLAGFRDAVMTELASKPEGRLTREDVRAAMVTVLDRDGESADGPKANA